MAVGVSSDSSFLEVAESFFKGVYIRVLFRNRGKTWVRVWTFPLPCPLWEEPSRWTGGPLSQSWRWVFSCFCKVCDHAKTPSLPVGELTSQSEQFVFQPYSLIGKSHCNGGDDKKSAAVVCSACWWELLVRHPALHHYSFVVLYACLTH